LIVTIRKYESETDNGLLEFHENTTNIRIGSTTMVALFGKDEFCRVFSPDGIWLAHDGKGIAGAILFGINNKIKPACTTIYALSVDEKYRRRGIGGALMYKAEIFTRNNGFNRLMLSTQPDNAAALTLFKKCWYSVTATSQNALTMEKTLRNFR